MDLRADKSKVRKTIREGRQSGPLPTKPHGYATRLYPDLRAGQLRSAFAPAQRSMVLTQIQFPRFLREYDVDASQSIIAKMAHNESARAAHSARTAPATQMGCISA